MKRIKLDSRYNEENYLDEVSPNIYKLTTENGYRMGFNDPDSKELSFVDPSGGPFISIGTCIDSKVVKRIFSGDNNETLIEMQ